MARLKKVDVLEMFREMWNELLQEQPHYRGDSIAKRTAWNDYTDGLCKDGLITDHQYTTWSNPF